MKKNKLLIECIIVFILSFLTYYLNIDVTFDDIWNYGFAYNIAHGLIPYKDFNMVITPFYPMIVSILLKLNSSLIIFYFANSIINSLMYYLVRKEKGTSAILFTFFSLLFCAQGYNSFLLFLFILLIYLENNNYPPFLIGVVAAIAVLTKQSVFPLLTLALIIGSNKESIKYRLLGFSLPFLVFLIYLLINDSLYQFIDYCFLGLKSFGQSNFMITSYILFATYILVNLYLLYILVKNKFQNKEILYILAFQIIAFPIFDSTHIYYCLLISLFYFLDGFGLNLKSRILFFAIILFLSITDFITYYNQITFTSKLKLFNGKPYHEKTSNIIYECIEKIENINYDDLYVFDGVAYIIKLELKENINKYDLINEGNMGKGGSKKYTEEIDEKCQNKNCLFVIRKGITKAKGEQLSIEIVNYVKNNYELVESVGYFEFYQNG